MARYFFCYVESGVTLGPEDGVFTGGEALAAAKVYLLEALQRNEVEFLIESEDDDD